MQFIDWIPYEQRGVPHLEADAAVCAHFKTMETRFAIRTRLFDAAWAGLPIASVEGDVWEQWVRDRGLGEVAPAEDPPALAAAIERLAENGKDRYAPALREFAAEHRWAKVGAPLKRLVDEAGELPPARPATLATRAMWARHAAAQRAYRISSVMPEGVKQRVRGWLGRG